MPLRSGVSASLALSNSVMTYLAYLIASVLAASGEALADILFARCRPVTCVRRVSRLTSACY